MATITHNNSIYDALMRQLKQEFFAYPFSKEKKNPLIFIVVHSLIYKNDICKMSGFSVFTLWIVCK